MQTIHLEHEIGCDEQAFWDAFLDPTYNKTLFREVLGFPSFEILEQHEDDVAIRRNAAAQPRLPRAQMALARLLRRRGFHFVEHGRFDKQSRTWEWDLEPNVFPSLLSNHGTVRIEPIGYKRVRRIVDIKLAARLPGIGRLIEASAKKRIDQGWRDSARFMNDWLSARAKN